MQNTTISIAPIPETISQEQIKAIFNALSVKNVFIDKKTAYVQFNDSGDLEMLQVIFEDQTIPQLNNAKIDVPQHFDWSAIKKENSSESKSSSNNSSEKHQDIMAADIKNLIVIQNCDPNILKNLSIEQIKEIFHQFTSVQRIIKKRDQVVVQFLDPGELQKIDIKFENFTIPQLGRNSQIERAEDTRFAADQFTRQWSKIHLQQSQITQESTRLGYQDQKPYSGEFQNKSHLGYQQEKLSQEVLHHQIIPPFDKKTSMEVNFLSEQSKLGYKQTQNDPIHQATTHQQLDYTSELKIQQNQQRFGYDQIQLKKEAQKQKQLKRKQQQQQEQRLKNNKILQQNQNKRKEQQLKRKQQQQFRKKQEEDLKKKQDDQKKRKQLQEKQLIRQYEEEALKRKQIQEETRKIQEEQAQRRRQSMLLDAELKQKLRFQQEKLKKQNQEKAQQQLQKKHIPPTDSENALSETKFVRQAGSKVIQELGYGVSKAKQEVSKLVHQGKQLIGHKEKQFIEHASQLKPENLGYQKWSVKPDVTIQRPISGTHKEISKRLVTITLAIWVIFLLFQ